jgi:hypothetical protein
VKDQAAFVSDPGSNKITSRIPWGTRMEIIALSGAPQVFVLKPIKGTGVQLAQAFAPDNQTLPDPFDFGARNHFGL